MSVIKGIYLPCDADKPIERVEFESGNIKAIQHYVGGWFQVVDIERPGASIFCDEEGKMKGSPLNRRATMLWWTHWTPARNVDVLMGDCLIIGQPDDDGESQSVPDELVNLLFNTEAFAYEVKVHGESGWYGNQVVLDDVWDAYNDGLSLAERWSRVEEVRVVAVNTDAA